MDEKTRALFESGRVPITMKEFLDKTGIDVGCWILRDYGPNCKIFKSEARGHPTIYFYRNGLGITWKFKRMPEYKELWVSKWDNNVEKPEWSMWSTFKILD